MKVGDTVYIVSGDNRNDHLTGTRTVTKVGNKYFEIEGISWDKFLVDGENGEHPDHRSPNMGVRTKDKYSSQLSWYPSEEVFNKRAEATIARVYIEQHLYLMDADELIDFANLLKERKQDVVRSK